VKRKLGNIPKYIYDQVNGMVEAKVKQKKRDVIRHYIPMVDKIATTILTETTFHTEAELKVDESWRDTVDLSISVITKPTQTELKDKIKKATAHIQNAIESLHAQIEDQYATWKLEVFTKSTDIYQSIPKLEIHFIKV